MTGSRFGGWRWVTVVAALAAGTAQATSFYWAGGLTNKVSGSDVLNPATGIWDTVTANWGDVTNGSPVNFSAWSGGAANSANFGTRTSGYQVTITNNAPVVLGGLNTYVFDGTGAGTVTLRGPTQGSQLVFVDGAVINVATGTTLFLASSSGTYPLGMAFTNFTITGGGTLSMQFYGGTFSSGVGTITVANATMTSSSGPTQWPFPNTILNLADSKAVSDLERLDEWNASLWRGVVGVGKIQPTGAAQGLRALGINTPIDTTFDSQLLNGAVAGGPMVLYKAGAGKLTVSNTNNAYFGNYVHQGTLAPAAANTVCGWVVVDGYNAGNGIFAVADTNVYASGGVTAESGGQINGANLALSQISLLAGGAVLYNAPSEIPGSGRVLNGNQAGAVIASGYAMDGSFLQRIQESFDGVIAAGANIGAGTTLDFSSAAGGVFPKARLGAWNGGWTFAGTLIPYGSTYRLGGGNGFLTVTAPLTGTADLDVSDGLNKQYFGQSSFATNGVVLSANNTFTGAVTVGNGATLILSNITGRLSGATNVTITAGGSLVLLDGATTNTSCGDRIPSVGVTIQRTGALRFTGTGNTNYIESVGPLTIDGGVATLTSARGNGSVNAKIVFTNVVATNWGTVNFTVNANSSIGFGIAPAPDGTLLGPWATYGGAGFAVFSASTGVVFGAVTTNVNSDAIWQTCGSAANVNLNGAFTSSGPKTVGSIVATGGATSPGTIWNWNGLNRVASGGILAASSTYGVFTNGQWTASTPDHGLYIYQYDLFGRTIALYSDIVDDSGQPVSVIAGGSAVIILASTNSSYSGATVVNGGTLRVTQPAALGASPNIVLNGMGCTLDLFGNDNRTNAQVITVNADARILPINGTAAGTPLGSTTLNGDIVLNNNSLLTVGYSTHAQPVTINSTISGTGSLRLRKYAGNAMTLQGASANTYSGDTYIAAPVWLNKASGNAIPGGTVYLGTIETTGGSQRPAVVLMQNNQIADSAVLVFDGGVEGTNTTVLSPVLRLAGKAETVAGLNSLTGNGIVENGSNTTTSVLTLSGSGSYAFGGLIWNGSGGTQALVKAGTGTQVLAGASTYTGGTTVNGGKLLVHNTAGSATGSGAVTVGSGGTFGGDGRVTGSVSVASGATLVAGTPDNPTGTLSILGSLVTSNGCTVAVSVSSATNGGFNVGGNITLAGSLAVTTLNGYRIPDGTYLPILMTTTGTISGKLTSVTDGYAVRVSDTGKQVLLSARRPGFVFSAQ